MKLSESTRLCSAIVGDDVRVLADSIAQLEAELLKFRRLDITWGEEVKELDLTIANLKEELGHLHSRFDRVLDDTFKEGG